MLSYHNWDQFPFRVLFLVVQIFPSLISSREHCSISHKQHLHAVNKTMWNLSIVIKLLKPTGHVMHHQFNIQQLYAQPTLYLCVLYLSENKQWLVPLTA